jgi:DNA primase
VATPLEWSELQHGLYPGQFHIGNARERFRGDVGHLFAGVLNRPQRLEEALGILEKQFR